MKRIICLLIAVLLTALTFTACSGSGTNTDEPSEAPTDSSVSATTEDGLHPLYIRVEKDVDTVTAAFCPNTGDDPVEIDMQSLTDEDDTAVYVCYADPELYYAVYVTVDGRESDRLSFNSFTSGWELSPGRELPFTYGIASEKPQYERVEFPYQERTKGVLIWTPDGYDKNSEDKYSVIYMTDGHNLFDPNATSTGSWAVAESIEAMMAQSSQKAIVVGIENMDGWRDDELTPNLGEPTNEDYQDGHGDYFCDFVVNTVMPYIEENYNVYTDRVHTAVCGSSSGGIESFYIAMEHPDKFGTVGALSPAFGLYDDDTWVEYLKEKNFSGNFPVVYLYCGKGDDLEKWLFPGTMNMQKNLEKAGYPEELIYFLSYDKAVHNELYWRIVFPDFLLYMFGEYQSSIRL